MLQRTRFVSSLAFTACAAFIAHTSAASPPQLSATGFCYGDGSGMACPCGNPGAAGEGCANSTGSGAVLTATGSSVVSNDDLVLTITTARAHQPCMFVQGDMLFQLPFFDGLFCLAGGPSISVEIVFLDASGAGSTTVSVSTAGSVVAGSTLYYQAWYRDPGGVSPCTTGSNFTQGLIIDWI